MFFQFLTQVKMNWPLRADKVTLMQTFFQVEEFIPIFGPVAVLRISQDSLTPVLFGFI